MKVQIDLDVLDDYMIEKIAGIGEESINENYPNYDEYVRNPEFLEGKRTGIIDMRNYVYLLGGEVSATMPGINENLEWLVMLTFGRRGLYFPKLYGILRYVKSLLPTFSDETLSYLMSKARARTDELALIGIQDGVVLWRAFRKDIKRERKRRRKMEAIGLK